MKFLLAGPRNKRRKVAARRPRKEDYIPILCRPPKPTPLARLLAIYHVLAGQSHLVNPPLLEHLASLKELGLLRFVGDRVGLEQDIQVVSRVELQLARACADELSIDLAEYLAD